MIDDRQEELASLHAFGLLEGEEKKTFVADMARDPDLAALVAELRFASTAVWRTRRRNPPPPRH